MSNKIACPKCQHSFEITDAMSTKIREEINSEFAEREAELKSELASQTRELESKFQAKLKVETAKAANLAAANQAIELADLQEQLKGQEEKLREATVKELELRKAQRDVEQGKRDLELTLSRRLDEERTRIQTEVNSRAAEEYNLKQAEWNQKQAGMEKLIVELKQKAEQGSTQTQGEALELELETVLKETFIHDSIEPVAKGVVGGDILQRVMTRTGQPAGAILYELKRTKNWSDGWITKLKDNQRAAKADLAVIVTAAMPEGIKHIGTVGDVWVCDYQSFIGLVLALRQSLLDVTQARQALVGKKEKLDYLYDYLSGVEFKGRIEAITEAFVSMKEDLESERRAFEKIWAKREKALTRALGNTAGVYGDLHGLLGASLQEIPQLTLSSK